MWITLTILGLSILGMLGILPLVQKENTLGNICLKLLDIPVCYIMASCLILVFVSLLNTIGNKKYLFFMATGISLGIVIIASAGNILGFMSCPKTDSGIPMCYLFIILFAALIFLKRKTIELEQ